MTFKTSNYNLEEDKTPKTNGVEKELPHTFDNDNDNFFKYFALSAFILHPLFVLVLWLGFVVAMLLGIHNPLVQKPEWKTKDIEFVLTQNEAEPINKNTKYRSDKNSRAGGIHDPNRKVSMPSPSPAPAAKPVQKQSPAPQPVQKKVAQKPAMKPIQKPVSKPVAKPVAKPAPEAPKAVNRPSKPMAPSQRPVLKPSTSTPKPQMPKLAKAPSSPFKVAVPNTGAPVGKGFSTSTGTKTSGGGGLGSSSGGSSKGAMNMPAPQFSTSRTASSASRGTGTRSGTGRGGYGTGNMGNPGPGNPKGAPGIDAIKSPQWGPYMRELESKIKRNWHPPKGDTSKRVVLLFKIGRRGELLSVRVSRPSGSSANDQAAMSAVQMSAPFRALPPEFTGSSVEIEFTFDYNVLGASYR